MVGKPRSRLHCGVLVLALSSNLATARGEGASLVASEAGLCSLEEAVPVTVARIDSDFDILLGDGRRVTLAGVEFPFPTADAPSLREDALRRLSDWLIDKQAFFAPLTQGPDRWGRVPARIFASGEGPDAPFVGVGETLLAEGHARFRPDRFAARCARFYLDAERQALRKKIGLWASANYAIVDTKDIRGAFNVKGMIVAEGVIASIGEAGGLIYLNFGPRRGVDFAAVILKRDSGTFERAGLYPRGLSGRRVRVRGLIETRFGPRMEISSTSEIELVDGSAAP
jgi:hypothetical protein